MAKTNPGNESTKRNYLRYLEEARGRDEATIDRVAKSMAGRRDFKRFRREQAMAFKRRLADAVGVRSGEKLSKATLHSTLRDLKAFFEWLSRESGFRSQIAFSDADYFNLSEKDVAIARARREKAAPTAEQVQRVLEAHPDTSALERRDRAVFALAALTGARVNALASFQLGHVDVTGGFVEQDARVVRTKFAKTFRTYFMPVVGGATEIMQSWIVELRGIHLWGPADPLFPATAVGLDEAGSFCAQG
jgi:site-specific recombinase XerD